MALALLIPLYFTELSTIGLVGVAFGDVALMTAVGGAIVDSMAEFDPEKEYARLNMDCKWAKWTSRKADHLTDMASKLKNVTTENEKDAEKTLTQILNATSHYQNVTDRLRHKNRVHGVITVIVTLVSLIAFISVAWHKGSKLRSRFDILRREMARRG